MWTGSHVDRKSRGQEVTWTGSHVDRKSRGQEVTWTGSHVDRKTRGQEVTWTGSHVDRKSRGPEVTWTGSHVDRKSRGPEVTWTGSHVDRKSRGPEVTWTGSHVDRKSRGQEVTWTGSHVDRKSRGPEVTWTGYSFSTLGFHDILLIHVLLGIMETGVWLGHFQLFLKYHRKYLGYIFRIDKTMKGNTSSRNIINKLCCNFIRYDRIRCQRHVVELSQPTPSRGRLGLYTGQVGTVLNVCVLRDHSQ